MSGLPKVQPIYVLVVREIRYEILEPPGGVFQRLGRRLDGWIARRFRWRAP